MPGNSPATTLFAFPADVLAEGADVAVGRMAAAGMAGVSLAAIYHDGRDLLPHNPRRRVKFQDDGVALFAVAPGAFSASGVRPIRAVGPGVAGSFEQVTDAARRRGLSVIAWTVFLHNTSLGRQHPKAVTRNVFGDPQFTSLCPANPSAVAYALGVAQSLARLDVDAVNAEALHYLPFEHGYHHERYFLQIGPIDRLLLGLCFCTHCMGRARAHGVDTPALEAAVRRRLERVFATAESYDASSDTAEERDTLWDGELAAYLRSREHAVTELVGAVHAVLREHSISFIFNDPAGALHRHGADNADDSWRLGIDHAALREVCDEVQMLAYDISPSMLAADAAAYQDRVGAHTRLRVAVRPMWPDCDSADNITEKLERLGVAGVAAVDFYAYDFMRLEELDRVAAAVRATGWGRAETTSTGYQKGRTQ